MKHSVKTVLYICKVTDDPLQVFNVFSKNLPVDFKDHEGNVRGKLTKVWMAGGIFRPRVMGLIESNEVLLGCETITKTNPSEPLDEGNK